MKTLFGILFLLSVGCSRPPGKSSVDTVMVFTNAPPCPRRDSLSVPSRDFVLSAIDAYHQKRIAVDSAATVILAYLGTGRLLNVQIDEDLQAALTRAMGKCQPRIPH